MTETEWVSESDVSSLIFYIRNHNKNDLRRLRLFGCACCRRVWPRLKMVAAAQTLVELAEAYADDESSGEELQSAVTSADFADYDQRLYRSTETGPQLSKLTHNLTDAVRRLAIPEFNASVATTVADIVAGDPDKDFFFDPEQHPFGSDVLAADRETAEQAILARDIFGNPFRPVTFDPAWRTDHTVGIATKMYDERNFDAMPILADALQDAGCDNEEILRHCREPGVHVRGCWVVDLVLGKV